MVIGRIINLDGRIFQIGIGVVGVNRSRLDTDNLALQISRVCDLAALAIRICNRRNRWRILLANDFSRRVVIFIREVDDLRTICCDRHRGENRVDLLGLQRRNDAIPCGADNLALNLHFFAKGGEKVDFETFPLVRRVLRAERWIGLRANADLQFFNGHCGGCRDNHSCNRC